MNRDTRLRLVAAAGILVAAGVAGWWSAAEPVSGKASAIISKTAVTPAKPAVSGKAAAGTNSGAALAALKWELMEALDPAAEVYSGNRLAELCSEDYAANLPGGNPAFSYAARWAEKDPRGMYEWFRQRGAFALPARGGMNYAFLNQVFAAWSKQDPAAALAGALNCSNPRDKAEALAQVVGAMRKTDPARAAALAAEYVADLDSMTAHFGSGANAREAWDFLRALPAGKHRDAILARHFEEMFRYQGAECEALWKEMPDELRRAVVSGGFTGTRPGDDENAPKLEGMDAVRRDHIAETGDAVEMRSWLNTGGWEWATRDPAAAIAWAREHLRGELQVDGTARMFGAGAAHDFEATLRAWQDLPEGVLRARAAGNLAALAPAERKGEVDAMLGALSAADLVIANAACENGASEANRLRIIKSMKQREGK